MPDIILRIATQAIAVNMQGRGPIGPPGPGGDAVQIQGVDVSDTAPTDGQILAYDATEDEYVPTDPSAASLPAAASQVEAEAGTETALRSWSPLRVGQSGAAKVSAHSALTTGVHGVGAGTVAKTADIPTAYGSNPEALGTAGPGNSTAWARGNHVHPTTGLALAGAAPTAHAASHITGQADAIQSATAAQNGLMTATQASKLDGIEAAADVTDATNVAAAGAQMVASVTSLPGSPVAGTLYRLTQADSTAKAAPGDYAHNGTGWVCLSYSAPYAWGNLGATPALTPIPGLAYTATQDQIITSSTVAMARPGIAQFTVSGAYAWAAPTMTGRTTKLLDTGAWTDAATALKLVTFANDGTYLILAASELVAP